MDTNELTKGTRLRAWGFGGLELVIADSYVPDSGVTQYILNRADNGENFCRADANEIRGACSIIKPPPPRRHADIFTKTLTDGSLTYQLALWDNTKPSKSSLVATINCVDEAQANALFDLINDTLGISQE